MALLSLEIPAGTRVTYLLVAVRCDLRQVRDCEHLAALAKLL